MLSIGIVQTRCAKTRRPTGGAYVFADYRASPIVIDGASSTAFHDWGELALALGWLAVLTLVVALALRRMLASTAWRAEKLHR